MAPQAYGWTCSVCSATWCLQSTGTAYQDSDIYDARYAVGQAMGYPSCVNEVYGCMSSQCVVDVFAQHGLVAHAVWVTFDQAYAIAGMYTGTINPNGMYHFMALRGRSGADLAVANSAPGYRGVYDTLSREQFNALGPVEVIYLEGYAA
jgi:hypothetical protein